MDKPFLDNFLAALPFGGILSIDLGFKDSVGSMSGFSFPFVSKNMYEQARTLSTVYLNDPTMLRKAHGTSATKREYIQGNKWITLIDMLLPFIIGIIAIVLSIVYTI